MPQAIREHTVETSLVESDEVLLDAPPQLADDTSWGEISRKRWQIIFGLIVAVMIPAIARWPDSFYRFESVTLNNTLIASSLALIGGYLAVRRLAVYPGIQVLAIILPAFSFTYGLAALIFFFTRIGYSRYALIMSFLASVIFYMYAFALERRERRARLAVVPGGRHEGLLASDRIRCSLLLSPDDLPDGIDGVVADFDRPIGKEWEALLARCALKGVPVHSTKRMEESLTGRVSIERLSEASLGSLEPSAYYNAVKRIIDLIVAIVALPFFLIVILIAGVVIKLDSRGPVLFLQERMGYRGRVFNIWKLRTMRVGSEADGTNYTDAADQRITRVGHFLRKYRIDELPQIVNILKGEMSWIGPRPEALALSDWYGREIAFYSYRHIIRPGITGWAQIHQGYAARPDNVKYKLHYDFYYIKHFSALIDLVIAVQTIRTILTGFGSR